MKSLKNALFPALALSLIFVGCEDGDKVFDEIRSNETRGAVLRTVNYDTNEIPIGATDYMFEVDLEVQDQANGGNVSQVQVYLSFDDNTIESGDPDLSKEEVLVTTLDAASFTTGEFGLPRTTYSIDLGTMLSTLGLSTADIFVTGGDEFNVRFALLLNDGRTYTNSDNSGTLTGSFFSSPFLYTTKVVCPPLAPSAGTWTIAMQDSYGDGWNGASVDITIDGTVNSFLIPDGSELTETLEVADGASAVSIIFNSGDWDSEITFQITSSTGTTILDLGPEPTPGVELLDYCDLSLDL